MIQVESNILTSQLFRSINFNLTTTTTNSNVVDGDGGNDDAEDDDAKEIAYIGANRHTVAVNINIKKSNDRQIVLRSTMHAAPSQMNV